MISEAETLKSKEFVKRRILRLQQVREQSKDLAKKIRGRVKDERGRMLKEINTEKEREVEKLKEKNIQHLKSQLDEGLAQIGDGHSAAIFEDLLQKEWEVKKSLNRSRAVQRGNTAAKQLHSKNIDNKKHHCCLEKSKSVPEEPELEEVKSKAVVQPIYEETNAETQPNPRIDKGGILEEIKATQTKERTADSVVKGRGDGDYNRDSVITANYFETSTQKECDDSLRKFHPTETIRQLQLSSQPTVVSSRAKQTIPADIFEESEEYYYTDERELPNLHTMSKNNPFSTAISDHIKNRRTRRKRSPPTDALPDDDASDMCELRNIIQHTRHAPPPSTPSIPKLPQGYGKTNEEPQRIINAGYKKSELTASTKNWLPSSSKAHRSQGCNCSCASCHQSVDKRINNKACKAPNARLPSRSNNLKKSHGSTVSAPKFLANRMVIKCRPTVHVNSKGNRCSTGDTISSKYTNGQLPKHIRTYDEANKTERTSVPDSNYMVERLPKEGKSAFDLARDERAEVEQKAGERHEYYNAQARRVRGLEAAVKLQKEKEYHEVIKAIDNYEKEQRRLGRKLPDEAFMSEHRLQQKHQKEQNKMDEAYEKLERQTKVHIHPEPIVAPVVQPGRRKSQERRKARVSSITSDDDCNAKNKTQPKNGLTGQPSVVNVAAWNAAPDTVDDDLDEIPTRDSDSTVKSLVIPNTASKADEPMNINRVLNLIEKQREQLLKEVARMERVKKARENSKSPKKKRSTTRLEEVQNSTTDDAIQIVEKTKPTKHRSPSPKVKPSQSKSNVIIKTLDNVQPSSNGSQNSISLQGFQIIVDVKQATKSHRKESVVKAVERSVQTTKSLIERHDSSTEVSIKAAKVVTTEKVTFESDDTKSKTFIDSSASTSYMSPPDKFSKRAVETYFGKQTVVLKSSETQTDPNDERQKRTSDEKSSKPSRVCHQSSKTVKNAPTSVAFFGSESTINHESRNESIAPQGATLKKVPPVHRNQATIPKSVLQSLNQNVTSKIDPKLKDYIHRLLQLSKAGINSLEIDVSDITTPGSSVVNIPSNVIPDMMKSDFTDKIEKLKCFIDENYSLLEQIEEERKFHRNYKKNDPKPSTSAREKQIPEVSSSVNSLPTSEDPVECGGKENKKVQPKKPKRKLKNVKHAETTSSRRVPESKSDSVVSSSPPERDTNGCNQGTDELLSSDVPIKPKVVPLQSNLQFNVVDDPKVPILLNKDIAKLPVEKELSDFPESYVNDKKLRFEKTSLERQQENIDHYKRLSNECTQRIQSLSQMLEQVRKDKQMTLSSNSSLSSDDGDRASAEHFVPILNNIPKPSNRKIFESGDIPIDVWAYDAHSAVPPLNLNAFERDTPKTKHRPPIAMFRNPIMQNADINPGTPHELSTIIEVDTPGPGRNASSLSKYAELSPMSSVKISRPKDGYGEVVIKKSPENDNFVVSYKNIASPPNFEADTTSVGISPFLSFQEFVKEHGLDDVDDILGDTTLKATNVADAPSDSEDTLPDIAVELLKRNLIERRLEKHHISPSGGSAENSSSDSAVYILQTSASSPQKKDEKNTNYPFLKRHHDVPSISGIDEILQTSSNSTTTASDNLMNDFEKALQSMGIHWAVSTLKKTKETMELSSTSSSVHKESVATPNKIDDFLEFSNISGNSVGLTTLLADINTPDNSLFKKYAADLSNSSINKQMESLFKKVSDIKKRAIKNLSDPNKLEKSDKQKSEHESKSKMNLFTEEASLSGLQRSKDRTQHRTSTPVQIGKLSSASSVSAASQPSNGLFSIESDLSSVKNVSNRDKNSSGEEKDTLDVPDMNLKFGKLFDATNTTNKD